MMLNVGQIVRYANPNPDETQLRFTLVEINGDRAILQLVCDWAIRPTFVVLTTDIVGASAPCSHGRN